MQQRAPESNIGHDQMARYVEYLRLRGSSERTVEGYSEMLRAFFRYLDEKRVTSLAEVTRELVLAYPTYLFYATDRRGRSLSPATQSKRLTALKSFYRFLAKYELVLIDLTEDLELPKETRALPVVLSKQDREKLFAGADAGTLLGYRDRTMLEVLYGSGIRISELVNLCIEDLRLAEGLLVVRQGKGKKDRTVPLGKVAGVFLGEYLARVRPRLVAGWHGGAHRRTTPGFRPRDEARHVFLSKGARPLSREVFDQVFKKYVLLAGLTARVTPHSLRHTFATDLLRQGAEIRHIQEMLGHTTLRTTQRYTHIVKKELKRVHERCHPREQVEIDEVRFRPREGDEEEA